MTDMLPTEMGSLDFKTAQFTDGATGKTRPLVVVTKSYDVTFPDKVLIELAESSIGFGLNPSHVDWDRFYEMLESFYGYDMQDMGGRADNRIRRRVSQLRKQGEISW